MASCKNIGSVDRGIRALLGVVALALAFTSLDAIEGAITGLIAGAFGIIMLLTAAIGTCPLYLPLKLSTCKVASK